MKIKKSKIVLILIGLLTFIMFSNLSGMLQMMFGLYAAFSPIILLICCLVFVLILPSMGDYLRSIYIQAFLLFMVSYLFLGTVSLLFDSSFLDHRVNLVTLYRKYINAIIIVAVYYFGFRYLMRYYSINFLLKVVIFFTSFPMIFILLGPVLGLNKLYINASEAIQMTDRATGFFENPNEAGALANVLLVLLLVIIERSKKKLIYILLIPVTLAATLVSLSKASLVSAIFILMLYLGYSVLRFFKVSFLKKVSLSLVLVSFFFTLSYGVYYINKNFDSLTLSQQRRINTAVLLLQGEISSKTTSTRTDVYKHGIGMIVQRPFLGYGFGSFHRVKGIGLGVHSVYLMVIGEGGIVVLLLLLFMLLLLSRGAFLHGDPSMKLLIFGLLIIFAFNILGTNHHTLSDRVFNGMLGISFAVLNISRIK